MRQTGCCLLSLFPHLSPPLARAIALAGKNNCLVKKMIYGNILLLKLIKFHIKQINFDFLILKFGRERSVFHSVFDKIFDKIRGTFKA